MALDVNKIHRVFTDLVSRRQPFDTLWSETAKYYLPTSMDWNTNGQSRTATLRGTRVFDDTPSWCAGRFAAALLGMIMNPAQKWLEFEMYTDQEEISQEGKIWLQKMRDTVLFVLQAEDVGFYDAMHEHLLDYGIFGEACMLIDKNPDTGLPRFTPYPLEQCYIGMDANRKPNQVFRKYEMTTQQLLEAFEKDSIPDVVQKAADANNWNQAFTVIHGVFPRKHGIAHGFDHNKPWASVYYLEQTKEIMRESGFDVFPFSCPRFLLFASEQHGQGPGTLSLSNVKALNTIIKTLLTSDQQKAAPAYLAQHRGWIKPLKFTPWTVNYYNGFDMDKALIPIGNDGQPQAGREWVEMYQNQIMRAFYLDRLISQQKAAEVKEVEVLLGEEERMRDLVPQLSRLHAESITYIVLNTVLVISDMMEPPPADIQENTVKLRYLSPLAKAQRMLEIMNANRTLQQVVIPISQIEPTATKAVDWFKFVHWGLDQAGFPQDVIVPEEQFRQQQAQDAQQQQAMGGVEALKTGSEAVKNLAQAQSLGPSPLQGYF